MGTKSLAVGRGARSGPAILRLAGLILVGVLSTAGAIDGLAVVAGILHPTFPVVGYTHMTLLLSGSAVGASVLAVLVGNLVNRSTRGRFLLIFVTTEIVAVALALVQTWLLRNLVSQDLDRALLLGSLAVLALAGTSAAARFRSIRAHRNGATTALTAIAVVLLTALAAGLVFLVYALSTIQIG